MFVWLSGSAFCSCSFHVLATAAAAKYEQQKQIKTASQTSLALPLPFTIPPTALLSHQSVIRCGGWFAIFFFFSKSDLCSNIFTLLRLSENFSIVTLRLAAEWTELPARAINAVCLTFVVIVFDYFFCSLWHFCFVLQFHFHHAWWWRQCVW